jgi:Predicted pyridoxal phosphate-dependent enzyme apparently involved in regulation of cell wall biogenesis
MKHRLADPMIDEEQLDAVKEVLLSKQLVHGTMCVSFEESIANYLDIASENVAVTSSCTASLHLALMALELKPGEGVLVPNFTFPATVNVVEQLGAIPIFVDVSVDEYVVTVLEMKKTFEQFHSDINIKGIIVVHEFGASADMDAITTFAKEKGLFIVEDAACAFGTEWNGKKVGLLSDIGCFSFHPRKAITTGEGGAIVSQNPDLIERCKVLRNHGLSLVEGKMDFVAAGLNYRMTNFQAALGVAQIKYFDNWIKIRRRLQDVYHNAITVEGVSHPKVQLGHTWQSYMLLLDEQIDRDLVIRKLRAHGVESNYGAYAVLDTRYYKEKYGDKYLDGLPVSSRLYKHGICLPLHQTLTIEDVKEISEIFSHVIGGLYEL